MRCKNCNCPIHIVKKPFESYGVLFKWMHTGVNGWCLINGEFDVPRSYASPDLSFKYYTNLL